jgi:hypothetical protein
MGYQIFLVFAAIVGVIIVQVTKSERRSRALNPPQRIGTIPDGYVPRPPPGPGWAQAGPAYQPPPMAHLPSFHPHQPSHQPPPHTLPTPQIDLDDQVRALMAAGNEVGAIRLLCDEAEMGIIAAQEYARALVRAKSPGSEEQAVEAQPFVPPPVAGREEERSFFGSAALGGSPSDYDERDEWASGWQETRDGSQQQFVDELWQSIREGANPANVARLNEIGLEPGDHRDEGRAPGRR